MFRLPSPWHSQDDRAWTSHGACYSLPRRCAHLAGPCQSAHLICDEQLAYNLNLPATSTSPSSSPQPQNHQKLCSLQDTFLLCSTQWPLKLLQHFHHKHEAKSITSHELTKMSVANGNNAANEPLEAICRCLYLIFTGPSTNAQLVQYGHDILDWYSDPAVTGDAEALYQLDTVRDVWKAELPKEADVETLGTMQILRERVQESSDKVVRQE